MKKTCTTLLFTLTLIFSGFAQCELDNASFENWSLEDFEVEDGNGTIYSNEVFLPENTVSVLRFLFIAFELFFDPAFGTILESDPQGFAGMDRSTDASDGEFAVKLQGGYGINFADIYSPKNCTVVPDSFAFDVKHVGDSDDTLNVFVIFDEGLAPLPEDEDDLANYPAYATGEFTYNSDSAYHRITLPIIENFDAAIDTFYYIIIATTDDSTYFLIDNMSIESDDDDPPPTCSFDDYPPFSLTQSDRVCICEEFSVFGETGFVSDFVLQDTVPPLFLVLDANDEILYSSTSDIDFLFEEDFCTDDPFEDLFLVQILYESVDSIGAPELWTDLDDIPSCHAVSEKLQLSTLFNVSVIEMLSNGAPLDDSETVFICNIDDIIEEFSFTPNATMVSTIFVIRDNTDIIVEQFETDQTTIFDLPPGNYGVGMAVTPESIADFVGQETETLIASLDCWWGSDNFYEVVVLDVNDPGCISSTIDSELASNIRILENPVLNRLEVQISQDISKSVQLSIFDMNGKMQASKSLNKLEGNLEFDVASFPQGSYVLQIVSDDGIASYKFMKM